MKTPKNLKLLLRLIIIPVVLLMIMVLILKLPAWLDESVTGKSVPAPPVASFGIIIPKGYSVHGIDVSKHQGNIDWKRVSRMENNDIRIAFVFIKATEGISRQDHKFETNWKHSFQNGLLRGAYHFYYPSRDAGKQADNFIETVKLSHGDLPPVVDIETSNGKPAKKICDGLQVFLDRLEKYYRVKPIIYTNINFYNTYLKGHFDDYPLWIAGYFDHDRFYNEFDTPWIMWQHSEKGKVDGIRGNVDFNVFNGNMTKLKGLTLRPSSGRP
jgi:lysozyme